MPDLGAARAGSELLFVVHNCSTGGIETGEHHRLCRDEDGTAVPVDSSQAVQNNLYRIESGTSREFTIRLPNPLPAGHYTILKTVNRGSTVGGSKGDPLELSVSFDLPAHRDDYR